MQRINRGCDKFGAFAENSTAWNLLDTLESARKLSINRHSPSSDTREYLLFSLLVFFFCPKSWLFSYFHQSSISSSSPLHLSSLVLNLNSWPVTNSRFNPFSPRTFSSWYISPFISGLHILAYKNLKEILMKCNEMKWNVSFPPVKGIRKKVENIMLSFRFFTISFLLFYLLT